VSKLYALLLEVGSELRSTQLAPLDDDLSFLLDRPFALDALSAPTKGRLRASSSHRAKLCCLRPVSLANCEGFNASLPVRRSTIFCLKARE
jgi:hypothetical protein